MEPKYQKVLITGGTGGVGNTIADTFTALGSSVHIGGPSKENLSQALKDNPRLSGSVCNVANRAQVKDMVISALDHLGTIHTLINCFGISGPNGALEDIMEDDWDDCITTNLTGMYNTMKLVIPIMKGQKHGCILNFSTASTNTRLPNRSAYIASKYGVEGLTLNCARELGPFNIRCNAILPGLIKNKRMDMVLSRVAASKGISIEDAENEALRHVSMKTRIKEQDVCDLALFLTSTSARHITGAKFEISGGLEWEE